MKGVPDTVRNVRARAAALGPGPWLLAVSGGADSMVLLDAAIATIPRDSITIATFDHGTGLAAQAAVAFVTQTARSAGVHCVTGVAAAHGRTEADWRRERWTFLSASAAALNARVVTGHTRDDQVETVFMRALRGAGPRGLAGLYSVSPIARPLLQVSRAQVAAYVQERNITFMTDPSNSDRKHLRNRVRLDLLPAIEALRPGFAMELLEIARAAAEWRARIEALALTFPMMTEYPGTHSFARAAFRGHALASLKTLWPPLAARAGVIMDRRGTERLAAFTIEGETRQAIQLAGGITVSMSREAISFRRQLSSNSIG